MAVIQGGVAGVLAEVEASTLAQRVTQRPMKVLAWNNSAALTGAMTGIVANAPIFSLRNTSTNLILVRRIGIGFMTTTAFTAAQALDFGLAVARSFTVNDTAGTDISPTVNTAKRRASLATPNVHIRIATAAALTAGTRTLDGLNMGVAAGGSAGLATGLPPTPDNLFGHASDDLPIVLAANEGVVISNLTLMGATGVVKAYVVVGYAELAAADYAS